MLIMMSSLLRLWETKENLIFREPNVYKRSHKLWLTHDNDTSPFPLPPLACDSVTC